MKKVTIILLSLAMVFCGVFAGCAKQSTGYMVKLPAHYSAEQPTQAAEEAIEPEEKTMMYSFGEHSLMLTYDESFNTIGRHIYDYTDEEKTVVVGRYANTGNIAYVIYLDGAYIIEETLTTEAEYRAWVEDYLQEMMPDEDLSQYKYSCTTSYVHNEGDSSSYLTYDGFYIPQENEEINNYSFDYAIEFNGYRTADIINVIIDPYVSADEPCCVSSVGYSNHEFDNFVLLNLDEQKVNAAIEEEIRNAFNTRESKLESCEVKEYYLVYEEGVFGVLCGVSVTVQYAESSDTYKEYEMVFVSIPTSDYTIND